MANLVFKKADDAKAAITDSARKEIAALYSKWSDEIGKKAEYYKTKQNASSWLQEMNMRQLQAQLDATSKHIANEVNGIVKDTIYQVSDAVVQANNDWLIKLGFPVTGVESAFVSVPDQTVRRLITGQIYESGWSLSKSIWGDNEDTLKKLYEIVAQGLAQNMTAYDISKLLEQYVDPSRAKQWNLRMADGKNIYKKAVDYNAQRLARTLAQHGYQTSVIAVTEKNPFILDIIWRANGSRVCQLCMDRDGQHFPKNDVPLDHPNGMCTMEPAVDPDLTDKLADWINNPDGTFPEIDAFASEFGYEAMPVKTLDDYMQKYGASSTLSPASYWSKATPYQKMEAEKLKSLEGIKSGDKWYIKNIYSGDGKNLGKLKGYYESLHGTNVVQVQNEVKEIIDRAWCLQHCVNEGMKDGWDVPNSYIDRIVELISNDKVPDEYKKAFAKAVGNIDFINTESGAFYRNSQKVINIAPERLYRNEMTNNIKTVFHEMGHAIDSVNRELWQNGGAGQFSCDPQFGFKEAMLKDLLNINNNFKENARDSEGSFAFKFRKMIRDCDSNGIQDVLSAVPNMKVNIVAGYFGKDEKAAAKTIPKMNAEYGIRPNYAHSTSYWKRGNTVNEAASELFAHMSAATVCEKEMKYMQTYFPNTVEAFGKIIAHVAKL